MSVHTGPRLPRVLLDQFSKSDGRDSGKFKKQGPPGRRERRKLERTQGKTPRIQRHDRSAKEVDQVAGSSNSQDEAEYVGTQDKDRAASEIPHDRGEQFHSHECRSTKTKRSTKRKDVGETPKSANQDTTASELSKRDKRKLEEDDAQITALEKKLGIKNKQKLPKSFDADGLGGFLHDLDDADEKLSKGGASKRKRGVDEQWLERKRKKSKNDKHLDSGSEELDVERSDEEEALDGSDADGLAYDFSNLSAEDDEPETDQDDVEDSPNDDPPSDTSSETSQKHRKKQRENPYVPPVVNESSKTQKYVPPSLRQPSTNDTELRARIRRQAQGQLNRLSDANILSIIGEIEKLYHNNPRQYVTVSLVELLLSTICDRTILLDAFIILHAGFIAAFYRLVGEDFGAQMIEGIVGKLDHYRREDPLMEQGKEANNLIALVSQLYNVQVVSCNLMFDYIRQFMVEISEPHTELLLKIIRSCGPQLRQDDPTSLKDIVITFQKKITELGGEKNLSVRTRFMIETIGNLKDNKVKQNAGESGLISERVTQMRKTLGSLNDGGKRTLKASDPLRVGLADVRNQEKRGRWWMPSTSTRPEVHNDNPTKVQKRLNAKNIDDTADANSSDEDSPSAGDIELDVVNNLDYTHRLNTPTRRAILAILVSSTDHLDAHMRLQKLQLTKSQRLQIPHVILHCVKTEPMYNAYYEIVARKLCGDSGGGSAAGVNDDVASVVVDEDADIRRHNAGTAVTGAEKKMRNAFVFGAWDLYRRIGLKGKLHNVENSDSDNDDEEGDDESANVTNETTRLSLANYAQFFGSLIAQTSLPLSSILRQLDLVALYRRHRQVVREKSVSSSLKPTEKNARVETLALTFVEVLLFTILGRCVLRYKKDVREILEQDKGLATDDEDDEYGVRRGLRLWFSKIMIRSSLVLDNGTKERKRDKLIKGIEEVCKWLGDGAV